MSCGGDLMGREESRVVSVGVSKSKATPKRFVRQQVPDSILNDSALRSAIGVLPSNYNFEIHKTVWRLKQGGVRKVALQFPEGLLMYSLVICDILEAFAGVEECVVLGDVTYGACCVDDFSASALGSEFLVHYGHSCLVPVDVSTIPCLYVFVDIQIDVHHLVKVVENNFEKGSKLALAGTIQFSTAIHAAKALLSKSFPHILVPQSKPLSPGEILGCTSPSLPAGSLDSVVFVADGRFHLESFMIANPEVKAFRYDPYAKVLTIEEYDQKGMRDSRRKAIEQSQNAKHWGVVLGTLGRQGNPRTLNHIEQRLVTRSLTYTIFLVSELSPEKISLFEDSIDSWIQIACPRLSIDWGEAFSRPLLTPYEAEVALGFVSPWWSNNDKCTSSSFCCTADNMCSCPGDSNEPTSVAQLKQSSAAGVHQHFYETDEEIARSAMTQRLKTLEVADPGESKGTHAEARGHMTNRIEVGTLVGGNASVEVDKEEGVSGPAGDGQRAFASRRWEGLGAYPMDYYDRDGGAWNSSYARRGRVLKVEQTKI